MIWRRVISWRIPVSMLGALLLVAGLFWAIDPETHPFPPSTCSAAAPSRRILHRHRPVSASTTPRGQLIYGALIGVLVFIIRTWGGYPMRSRFRCCCSTWRRRPSITTPSRASFGQRKSNDA